MSIEQRKRERGVVTVRGSILDPDETNSQIFMTRVLLFSIVKVLYIKDHSLGIDIVNDLFEEAKKWDGSTAHKDISDIAQTLKNYLGIGKIPPSEL